MLYSVLVFVGFLPFKNTSGCTWFEPNSTEFWSLLRSSEFDCIKCWCYFRQAKHKIRWSASDCLCSACPWGVWPAISTQDSNRKTHRWTLQQQTQLHCWNNCMSKHIKWSPAWHQCGSTDCNLVMIRIQRDSTSSSREHHGKRHDVVPMLHWLHVHSTTWPEIMWIMLCHPNVRGKTTLPGRAANAGQKHITKSLSANATSKRTATPRKTRVQSASHQKNLTCQLTLPAFGAPTLNSWGHLEIAIGPSFLRWGLTHSRYEGRNGFVGLYFMFTFIGLLLI